VETGRGLWLYGLSPLLFLCGLATKEVAVTLPAALLLWELVGPAVRPPWRTILQRQAVHWTLLGVSFAVLLLHSRYEWLLTFSLGVRTLGDNLLTQVHGITYLLSRLVWVHRLNIDPDLPVITQWTGRLAMEAGGLALLLALGLANLRRRPWLAFGILWLFLHLLPTNSILPRLDVANERQLYLPGWGIFLGIGVLLVKLRERAIPSPSPVPGPGLFEFERSMAGPVLTVGLVVLLGVMTVARNQVYRSEIALWEDTAAKSPQKARVYNNLGYAYYLAGRHAKAREAYETALRLDPRFELAGNNLLSLDAKAMALVQPALANP
jgi:tetratricopeptide (TPR) repeat protein